MDGEHIGLGRRGMGVETLDRVSLGGLVSRVAITRQSIALLTVSFMSFALECVPFPANSRYSAALPLQQKGPSAQTDGRVRCQISVCSASNSVSYIGSQNCTSFSSLVRLCQLSALLKLNDAGINRRIDSKPPSSRNSSAGSGLPRGGQAALDAVGFQAASARHR